jgi:hypothetical protein
MTKFPDLIAHWPLASDANDTLGRHHGQQSSIHWSRDPETSRSFARFNGRDSKIVIPSTADIDLGGRSFSVALMVRHTGPMRGPVGDLVSKFDTDRRCGLHLWAGAGSAGYSSFSDASHIHAGIDDGCLGPWIDRGRPVPDNPLVSSLTVFQGSLYAGTTDAAAPQDACRVLRLEGRNKWVDCGRVSPDMNSPSVMSMIVHDGALYACTGTWDWGRADEYRLAKPAMHITGVYRYAGGKTWHDTHLPNLGQRVFCFASFRGALYAGFDRGAQGRCFKLESGQWTDVGVLDDKDNFECLMPFGDVLYGASHFAVYRYDGGQTWNCIGRRPHGISQIHALQVYQNKLWVGTWPQGYILRLEDDGQWTNTGLVGVATDRPGVRPINEINSLAVHNGKLYAGVLPKAQVYRYENDGQWTLLDNLASTPSWDQNICPTWMRVLSMCTYKGQFFACTGASQARTQDIDPALTAGRVLSTQAGVVASHDHDLGKSWRHIAVTRTQRDISLYIDGVLSQKSRLPARRYFDLGNDLPLQIGAGPHAHFDGDMADVRLYSDALTAVQVKKLASQALAG